MQKRDFPANPEANSAMAGMLSGSEPLLPGDGSKPSILIP
jgi:hypothetical protein